MIILYSLAAIVALIIAWRVGLAIYSYTRRVLHDLKMLDLDRAGRERMLEEPSRVYPDSGGAYPQLVTPDGKLVLDPDRGLLFDWGGLVNASPPVHDWASRRRMLQSLHVQVGGGEAVGLLQEPERTVEWPTKIPLKSLAIEPDIRSLVLGITIGDGGQQQTVKADMGKLVHIAVGGSSGWGKSVFLRAMAYQLALSATVVEMAMIDLEGATLAPFSQCGRLLFPIADTEKDALAVLLALQDEMERRKGFYAQHPGVDSLGAYNSRAGDRLTPLVAIIDEATALLGDRSVETALRTLALRARKYGLWLLLAGQDWKASSLDTAIRNQLSSRIQFRAMSGSQSRVLLEQGGAEDLDVVGRALAILPGRAMFTLQAPYISAQAIMTDCSDGGPRGDLPIGEHDDLAERVQALWSEGLGLGAIAEKIWGYRNARKTAEIKAILGLS